MYQTIKKTHVLDVSNCNSDDVKSDVLSCIKEKLNTFLMGGSENAGSPTHHGFQY
jgi:hypothetical protein